MKTEVYSWRVSTKVKMELEREARRRKTSVAAVLDLAAREWLQKSASGSDGEAEQTKLHKSVSAVLGTLAGSDPYRAENARSLIRDRIQRRYER